MIEKPEKSSSEGPVIADPVDLPDHFENWWATSRFKKEPAERYSDRKQLAWDAFYAGSKAPPDAATTVSSAITDNEA